jgi:RNA polymerase sigma factor (sigma-70 family)
MLERPLVLRVYALARAERWSLSPEVFADAVESSVAHAFVTRSPTAIELARYAASLHLEDLALATACALGNDAAWEHFVRELRPGLYRAADAIDATGGARELADSLYGELFGVANQSAERKSLFRYFHGRSSLATWLRAVLAQRHVDRLRRERRTEPLPEEESTHALASAQQAVDPARPRFVAAMCQALVAAMALLAPRDRLRLACYYSENLTLAAIGRLLSEHEATVSRHLARTRRDVRQLVESELRARHGFTDADLAQCFESVTNDSGSLDLAEIFGGPSGRKIDDGDRSKE